jgi:predicted PurR-regulated permease PerM
MLLLLAGAFFLAGVVLWPFRTPIFLAVVLAGVCHPLHMKLTARLKGRRRLASGLMALALLVLLVAPVASVLTFLFHEVTAGLAWIRDEMGVSSVKELSLEHLPASARDTLDRFLALLQLNEGDLKGYAQKALAFVQGTSGALLGASLGLLGGMVLMVVGFWIFLSEGEAALSFLYSISPLTRLQTAELFKEFRSVSTAAVLGTAATALTQAVLATSAFLVAGVPHAIFLGATTLIASFIPVVGSALIWVPVCTVLAFQGRVPAAIAVALWCGVFVGLSDNIIKPLVMKNGVEMHTALVFLSLLGGLAAFGLIGIILGPLTISLLLALLRMYRRDFAESFPPPPVG